MTNLVRIAEGGRERQARLDWNQENETYRARLESEEEKTAQVIEVESGVYSVLTDGRIYEARVCGENRICVAGRTFAVEVIDPRRWNKRAGDRGREGRQSIAASMPGKVVRVLVVAGDQVEAGRGLVVVEAMKMQNELKAARDGRVITVSVAAGATVNAGEVLLVIE